MRRAAAGDFAHFGQVLGALYEGKRDPVDTRCQHGIEVAAVLLGQRADRQIGIWQGDTFAVGYFGAGNDRAVQRPAIAAIRPQLKAPVVDEQPVAWLDRLQDFRMRQVDSR